MSDEVVALDVNRAFLAQDGLGMDTHLLVGDATALPISDECVDTVVATEVLEHVPSDSAMASEISRVLRPDGHLIITVPNDGVFGFLDPTYFSPARAVLRIIGKETQPIHRHYSLEKITTVLGKDFRIEEVSRTGSWLHGVCVLLVQLSRLTGSKRLERTFNSIGGYDYQLDYGKAAYNLAIRAMKVRRQQPSVASERP
jgi:SAM-dependent methyltransferase